MTRALAILASFAFITLLVGAGIVRCTRIMETL